jgi:tyrosine-protein phosphatase SIW14
MGMRWLLFVSLFTLSGWAAEVPAPAVQVRNFAVVNSRLFRGGEPSAVGLTELRAAGVQVDIDLRESSAATEFEKKAAERLGIKYVNMPLRAFGPPSPADMHRVLNLLAQQQSQTIFVHCRRGKDRTGTVIACYRIQHDGWDGERALREARSLGMSSTERGMKAFILHFTPEIGVPAPLLPTP